MHDCTFKQCFIRKNPLALKLRKQPFSGVLLSRCLSILQINHINLPYETSFLRAHLYGSIRTLQIRSKLTTNGKNEKRCPSKRTSVKWSESGLSAIFIRSLHLSFASAIFNQCNVLCSKQKQKYLVINFMSYVFSKTHTYNYYLLTYVCFFC